MTDTRAMWTYYKGEWREGDVRILGAASQRPGSALSYSTAHGFLRA
ncbi:aminotransferase [Brucella vulpis]|nr:aminotransferase [Brucella vulpis]CUW51219.1 aminotransferase [Brucella vulpis]